MKINAFLINVVMMYLEDNLDYGQEIEYPTLVKNIPDFYALKGFGDIPSEKEIAYALKKIEELYFIEHTDHQIFTGRKVTDITYTGHKYLNDPKLF